jgi:hypothetical protein
MHVIPAKLMHVIPAELMHVIPAELMHVIPAEAGIYNRINSELDPRLKHSGMTFGL